MYTGEFLTHWNNAHRIITFCFLYHGMVVAKQLAALVIEDVPGDVQIQIDRQEFVEKKLIFCAADVINGKSRTLTPMMGMRPTSRFSTMIQ